MVDGVISEYALLGRAEFSDGGSIQDIAFFLGWILLRRIKRNRKMGSVVK